MKKNLFILGVLLILNNCGGFEFAYKTQNNEFLTKYTTITHVDGDDANKIRVLLVDKFGIHDDFPKINGIRSAHSSKRGRSAV